MSRTIFVTGGANGVGRHLVLCLLRLGDKVLVGDCDMEALKSLALEAEEAESNLELIHFDLRNVVECMKTIRPVLGRIGRVDGYVHYAGITPKADFLRCSIACYEEILDVNLKGAFFCCQLIANRMIEGGGGSIVLISSAHADGGEIDRAPYAVSKAALESLGRHIAKHYSARGIRCNILTMGWTLTEGELSLRARDGLGRDELLAMGEDSVPMGRMLQYDDYIEALLFLLSPSSSMVAGSNLRVTGGQYI